MKQRRKRKANTHNWILLKTGYLGRKSNSGEMYFMKAKFSFVKLTETGKALFKCKQNGEIVERPYSVGKLAHPYRNR